MAQPIPVNASGHNQTSVCADGLDSVAAKQARAAPASKHSNPPLRSTLEFLGFSTPGAIGSNVLTVDSTWGATTHSGRGDAALAGGAVGKAVGFGSPSLRLAPHLGHHGGRQPVVAWREMGLAQFIHASMVVTHRKQFVAAGSRSAGYATLAHAPERTSMFMFHGRVI